MTTDEVIYTMIKDLLSITYQYYLPENIFYAYQNNYKIPQADDFIIITRRNSFQNGMPIKGFDVLNQKKIITAFGDWEYQIDLYGPFSDDASYILYTYLNSSSASNYLLEENMGIGKLYDPKNLSKSNDRDRYMKRYMILFTAMNISNVLIPTNGINLEDINITSEGLT
jgi:hypothetical protein